MNLPTRAIVAVRRRVQSIPPDEALYVDQLAGGRPHGLLGVRIQEGPLDAAVGELDRAPVTGQLEMDALHEDVADVGPARVAGVRRGVAIAAAAPRLAIRALESHSVDLYEGDRARDLARYRLPLRGPLGPLEVVREATSRLGRTPARP